MLNWYGHIDGDTVTEPMEKIDAQSWLRSKIEDAGDNCTCKGCLCAMILDDEERPHLYEIVEHT